MRQQLFRCVCCDRVDMEDLAISEATRVHKPAKRFHCTKCLTGQWHDQFPYVKYNARTDDVMNPPVPPSCS